MIDILCGKKEEVVKRHAKALLWGVWFALFFMALPYVIHGFLFAYEYQRPASDFVSIEYIHASDVGPDGVQYITMCRHSDIDRRGEWTWELAVIDLATGDHRRVFGGSTVAVMEHSDADDNCIIEWNSKEEESFRKVVEDLSDGNYQWEVIIEFTIDYHIEKTLTERSNIFTKSGSVKIDETVL